MHVHRIGKKTQLKRTESHSIKVRADNNIALIKYPDWQVTR